MHQSAAGGCVSPDDLVLFAHVVEAGTFTRAAQQLGLPKSTLSRRLTALEGRLGERLLTRTTRRLLVTEFGTAMLAHARQVVAEVAEAQALAEHRQARPSGRLRVSMPADVAMLALADMLAGFAQAHPAVALELDLSPRRVDLVAERVDVALRMGELPDDARLAARRLAVFTGGLYAAPDWVARHGDPPAPEALLAPDCAWQALVLAGQSGEAHAWQLETRLAGAGAPQRWQGLPARRVVANSPALLLQLARAGVGVALAADRFAADAVQAGALVRVLAAWRPAPVPAWAVFPERRWMPAKTRAFIDALAAALAEPPPPL